MVSGQRESPLLPFYRPESFELGVRHDMTTALRAHQPTIQPNFVADLSAFRRVLVVGETAGQWLADQGIGRPLPLLGVATLGHDGLLVRIHRQQYLVLEGSASSALEGLFARAAGRHDDVLLLPYESAEIACGGPASADILAELCPADLSRTGHPAWIMTRFAHAEVALRTDMMPNCFRLLCTPADAAFLFGVLAQINRERDGSVLGFDDFQRLQKPV